MTAQIDDGFTYLGKLYAVAGISEGRLFDPARHGMQPVSNFSACWRGYIASFALLEHRLVLEALSVSLLQCVDGSSRPPIYSRVVGPTINGVTPTGAREDGKGKAFNNFYRELAYPIDYSGGLLLADGFVPELYVHMGFHPAWKYRNVVELVFDEGHLTSESDRSAEVAEARERIVAGPQDRNDIAAWIDRCFDRTYGPK